MSEVKQYLEQMTALVRSAVPQPPVMTPMEFCLRHGKDYTEHSNLVVPKLPAKQCFENAFKTAEAHGLTYVEGWATCIIPVEHAWCVDKDGKVVDPTWGADGKQYFGVEFSDNVCYSIQLMTECWGILGCWWKWPEVLALLEKCDEFKPQEVA